MSLTTLPIPVQPQAGVATIPDFGFATFCRNASELGGGDVCEVLRLSGSSLLLIMADVMGKGAGASVFAGAFRTLARAVAHPQVDPAACLAEINELMFSELSKKDTFITAQLVVADLKNRQLLVANAGHCPMLVADGFHSVQAFAPQGMPLGVEPRPSFESDCVPLEPFSSVLLYTDGITETRNASGKLFGQQRLERWFSKAGTTQGTAAQLKAGLLRHIEQFQGEGSAHDDQSFLFLADETPRPVMVPSRESLAWFLPRRRRTQAASLTVME
ncbi:MAG TPA: PP2C family protein-serine/threonine phosphatase [Verrucomicrobiae bacterium]|jgi:sigma-B regulation protein RsbU (phosphoserine phosphatase)|nr:PP2C family protein-serine/threonine phosphatase [Verrucomicrobiae bacterium]